MLLFLLFFQGNEDDDDDDDDIGALGSILSWDEYEEGGVAEGTNSAISDRESMNSSTLPDLVSFNLKDGGLNLQQLAGSSGIDASIPLPSPINFGQTHITMAGGQQPVQQKQEQQKIIPSGAKQQASLGTTNTSHVQQQQIQQQQILQLQQQIQLQQQQQLQIRQQPPQQQQQQLQIRQQPPQQHLIGAPTTAQQPQQAAAPPPQSQQQPPTAAQQQQQVTQQATVAQSATVPPNLAQQMSLFQQQVLLAQSQNAKQQPLTIGAPIQTMMMPNVAQTNQEQRADQQSTPQFTFATDPGAFFRQLQVAQLQQQFNAVQQARPLTQQFIGAVPQAAHVPSALQQQIQFQAQAPMVAPVPVAAAQPPTTSPPKKARAPLQKKPPTTKTNESSKQTYEPEAASIKAPVVSASDTDGELSSKMGESSTKSSKKFIENLLPEIDTSNMTPEEKARSNRDRNREHARNTRLRKKQYLEKLKTTVDELCRERDTLVSERAGAANILVEMHSTRTEVLMSYFALRSANEKRRELWASILDESCFACVVPVTPYRSFPASEVQVSKCQRTILGIDGMMSDTASLHVLLNSLVDRSRFPNATIVFRYTLVTEEAVVAGNQMMARWVMTTLNATQCGARMEVAKQGMLCCKFNSAHKITGLELMFDVMALMLQLKQAAGSNTFSVIPNTVQTCQRSFDNPMVMTLAEEPYSIVQVNKLWEEMTGYKAEDVVGKASCRILEGEETDPAAVEVLMNEIRFKRPASAMVVNYKKTGERFRNFFLAYPLSTDSRITHYLSLSTHVDTVMDGKSSSSSVQPSQQGVMHSQNPETSTGAGQIAPTAAVPLPNFFNGIQNLQGSVSAGQSALAHLPSQPLFGLPPVLSNPLTQGAMLPPSMGAPNGVMQQYSVSALKRAHESQTGESSRKQAKAGDAADNNTKLIPSTGTNPK